jgi:hypothetical protein
MPAWDEAGNRVEQAPHTDPERHRVRQAIGDGYDKDSAILATLGEGNGVRA